MDPPADPHHHNQWCYLPQSVLGYWTVAPSHTTNCLITSQQGVNTLHIYKGDMQQPYIVLSKFIANSKFISLLGVTSRQIAPRLVKFQIYRAPVYLWKIRFCHNWAITYLMDDPKMGNSQPLGLAGTRSIVVGYQFQESILMMSTDKILF